MGASWALGGRLGGALGVSRSAWERSGASDHAGLCLRAGPGPETTGPLGGKLSGWGGGEGGYRREGKLRKSESKN